MIKSVLNAIAYVLAGLLLVAIGIVAVLVASVATLVGFFVLVGWGVVSILLPAKAGKERNAA